MSKALYRKYRSRSFDEIVGQNSVVAALSHAVSVGDIGHAYLFTGPRGVGKTSIARIFAYAINNIPYDSEELPIDIIEIDAASNRGIDEVRDLREKVRVAPVVGPYKIYIIDEVHMLTSHAFNALLKTLEEPPAHVVFILATTEGHRLPDTITSRTQRYVFKLASSELVKNYLKEISNKENINIDDEALDVIARHSGGSLRDALSMLDHARHLGAKVTAEDVLDTSGLPDSGLIDEILTAITSGNVSELVNSMETIESRSISPSVVATSLYQKITSSLQNNELKLSVNQSAQLLSDLAEVDSSTQPMQKLQISLIKACSSMVSSEIKTEVKNPVQTKKPKIIDKPPIAHLKETDTIPTKPNEAYIDKAEVSNTFVADKATEMGDKSKANNNTADNVDKLSKQVWDSVLEELRLTHNTLYSVLRMAEFDDQKSTNSAITLNFAFPFHLKRVSESKNKAVVQQKLADIGHQSVEILCELKNNIKKPAEITDTTDINEDNTNNTDAMMSKIRGVFGAAEVLE